MTIYDLKKGDSLRAVGIPQLQYTVTEIVPRTYKSLPTGRVAVRSEVEGILGLIEEQDLYLYDTQP